MVVVATIFSQMKTFGENIGSLPSNGLSEVTGIVSDTVFRNTVSERRIVTPDQSINQSSSLQDQDQWLVGW